MRRLSLLGLLFAIFVSAALLAAPIKLNGLYVNTFGNPSDQALIFVHGGPGYDSQDFEQTTAAALAAEGFFVIVYDQRGQGRSDIAQGPKDYSYQQYADDLKAIIQQRNLVKPVLLGHSHGGPISLKFDQLNPGIAGKIILISAPVNFWQSMDSIRINCAARYIQSGNTADLAKLQATFVKLTTQGVSVENEIKATAEAFGLGAGKACGLYQTSNPTSEAIALKKILAKNHVSIVNENLFYPMPNFLINESYIRRDQSQFVQNNANHIFGIYGDEDGLFTPETLAEIQSKLSKNTSAHRFQVLTGASHGLYIDQQFAFITALKNVLN